jgi:eukaryotic-like serine/threonine-protein kinase
LSDSTGISQWKVKISDFGMSRYADDNKNVLSRSSQQMQGNLLNCQEMWPNWASPEVLRGEAPSEASDVYSFGMILHEMLTGDVPN